MIGLSIRGSNRISALLTLWTWADGDFSKHGCGHCYLSAIHPLTLPGIRAVYPTSVRRDLYRIWLWATKPKLLRALGMMVLLPTRTVCWCRTYDVPLVGMGSVLRACAGVIWPCCALPAWDASTGRLHSYVPIPSVPVFF